MQGLMVDTAAARTLTITDRIKIEQHEDLLADLSHLSQDMTLKPSDHCHYIYQEADKA